MSNIVNSLTYRGSADVLSLVIGALENPGDVERARGVCKTWRNQYSVQNMIGDIEAHDKRLWTELINITKFIEDGRIHYIDDHNGKEKSVDRIVIVQHFQSNGAIHRSWLTPLRPLTTPCKNPLIEDETGQLTLSRRALGRNLGQAERQRLDNGGICYQWWGRFLFGGDTVERNILISVNQLRTAIKANNIRHGYDQDTRTSI